LFPLGDNPLIIRQLRPSAITRVRRWRFQRERGATSERFVFNYGALLSVTLPIRSAWRSEIKRIENL